MESFAPRLMLGRGDSEGACVRRDTKVACYNWLASTIIGLMPLLAHLLIYFAGRPERNWNSSWAPDLLFITISNSGLAAVTVFIKMLAGDRPVEKLNPVARVVWVTLLVCFALASMLYGVDVTGSDNGRSWEIAVGLVILSGICSLNFEIALSLQLNGVVSIH